MYREGTEIADRTCLMLTKDQFLDAALGHVPFDGWSEATMRATSEDLGMTEAEALALFPRGALDLALAYHRAGDAEMVARLKSADLNEMRFRDLIAAGVKFRLEVADKELVRKGIAFFALPQNAADGTAALWDTCDAIWNTLGDSSRDINWYTKRATLSAVYSSTVLFWLGDHSEGHAATWAFLDRRIDNVMQFEKVKAQARENKLVKAFMSGPGKIFETIKAPGSSDMHPNYPGRWAPNPTQDGEAE
ncbi:COQ9 family protein [Aliiroseovarius sp. KMU-50]|uniref:COQ9 family protein n=1 Tax=Aliiroseovarius salicola TaxID=3009082 RepID=A0ABT4W4H0_9RHOB|nr:COQ9 family protein [Aliiroseovarius sp. KMU-50]MDA5095411.1 COQ9 family protein [Aliiroseovarius sp. KMU-50]